MDTSPSPLIIEITGPRRGGKSTVAQHLASWYGSKMERTAIVIDEIDMINRDRIMEKLPMYSIVILDGVEKKKLFPLKDDGR